MLAGNNYVPPTSKTSLRHEIERLGNLGYFVRIEFHPDARKWHATVQTKTFTVLNIFTYRPVKALRKIHNNGTDESDGGEG